MAYAPHCNTHVAQQIAAGILPTPLPLVLGVFTEKEYGHPFEYAERRWPDDEFHPELPHIIYVGDGQTRLAKVLKTVAWVLCGDEDLQKWDIKGHRVYGG